MDYSSQYYSDYMNYWALSHYQFYPPTTTVTPDYSFQELSSPCYPTTPCVPSVPSSSSTVSPPTVAAATAPERRCTNCGVSETCRWRNVSTNITCNACFTYFRKYKKQRPESAKVAYKARKDQMLREQRPY